MIRPSDFSRLKKLSSYVHSHCDARLTADSAGSAREFLYCVVLYIGIYWTSFCRMCVVLVIRQYL